MMPETLQKRAKNGSNAGKQVSLKNMEAYFSDNLLNSTCVPKDLSQLWFLSNNASLVGL